MQLDPQALLRYWRSSLADAELSEPEQKLPGVELSMEDLRRGRLPPEEADVLVRAGGKLSSQPSQLSDFDDPEPEFLRVLIAPLSLVRTFDRGQRSDPWKYTPLWFGATLESGGTLTGDPSLGAWMVRRYLEPIGSVGPILGALADADHFLSREDAPESPDWQEHLDFAEGLFHAVTGMSFDDFELPEFTVRKSRVIPADLVKGAGQRLLTLYDRLLEAPALNPVVSSLARRTEARLAAPPDELAQPGHRRHLGQMTDAFALAPSQRQSLHAVLELEDFEIAAIEGPPGTGKTTLLRSVVAAGWVESAIAGGEPPVVHACSNNNQAVTNILDSFDAAATGTGDVWAHRWLPNVGSYGLYLPSYQAFKKRSRQLAKYQCAQPGSPWTGFPETMEQDDYVAQAEAAYLRSARIALPESSAPDVDRAVEAIHQELHQLTAELEGLLDLAARAVEAPLFSERPWPSGDEVYRAASARTDELYALRREVLDRAENIPILDELLAFLSFFRRRRDRRLARPFLDRDLEPPHFPRQALLDSLNADLRARLAPYEAYLELVRRVVALALESGEDEATIESVRAEPKKVIELLDRTLRYRLFQVAGRYWEGRWLLDMRQLLETPGELRRQNPVTCRRRLQRLAKITPIMVSTFYLAPKIFEYYDGQKGQPMPLEQGIDLLIVDEAGQVAPEVGAPVFALARRAVVVGDVHQIEPIWGVTPPIDHANLVQAGFDPERWHEEGFENFRSDRGSVMQVAQKRTRWSAEEKREGLFLSEHRRSVPKIIAYCNELVYRNRLVPKRQAPEGLPLPSLGWAHVHHRSERRGSSRFNPGQARALAEWLRDRAPELRDHYRVTLGEIVGIITPFAAQRAALKEELRRAGLADAGIEVGTVHTFQGAERPVMLFSSVYSRDDGGSYFYDVGPNMLNVAVSRARDAFIVFGDMTTFDPRLTSRPSGLLAKHLFASPENEITDVISAQELLSRGQAGTAKVEHLVTLEDHRQALAEAFVESRERVLVVSPYLSPYAIEADDVGTLVRRARERGVEVVVAYGRDLKSNPENTAEAIERLRNSGAEVVAMERIHNKTLAVDTRWLAEGSFNWLSAVRDESDRFSRQEASLRCGRPAAEEFIQQAWQAIRGAAETSGR